jgi:hypothetical protein
MRSGAELSADRRYLTLVAVDRLPNASQPNGWQGATGSSLKVTYQLPQPGASAGGNRSPKGPARQGAGPPGSSYSPPHHDAGSTEL